MAETLQILPPSEYIRKIGDHFISFIQKLDNFFENEGKSTEEFPIVPKDQSEQEPFAQFYI